MLMNTTWSHTMSRKTFIVSLTLAGAVLAAWASQSRSQIDEPLRNIMKAKLLHTQSILEGLALEDFNKIQVNAQTLSALSKVDAWHVHKTPDYIRFSAEFQRHPDALAAHAKDKKLDACTLDYVQLTMTCVNCHTHTRKIGVASADALRDDLALR